MTTNNCRIQVIATTNANLPQATKQDFDTFGGISAGVCYMQDSFDTLRTEDPSKTERRINMTKASGHHSVYDHLSISMFLQDIPRVIECMLDNERMMTSSVKSGRYTRHTLPEKEAELYDKWVQIFKEKIREKYPDREDKFMTDSRVEKLAMENARYLTSSFTQVSMIHTMSYRQLNYVYGFMRDFLNIETDNPFTNKLKPYVKDFIKQLELTGYIDEKLTNSGKERQLSLFKQGNVSEYFGDVYITQYKGSFAYMCHANRHRTLKHHIAQIPAPSELEFYTPEILQGDKDLCTMWLADLETLRDSYPQAMLLDITEKGDLEDFILKLHERKCSVVMLETLRNTNSILKKYAEALHKSGRTELDRYTRGSRCTFGNYECPSPCGFAHGINEKRVI